MHRTYFFLLDYEGESPKDWRGWAEWEFEDRYVTRCCDVDNWYQALALILPDGELFDMCPEDDHRERYETQQRLSKVPKAARWGWVVYWATARIAEDLGLLGCDVSVLWPPRGSRVPGELETRALLDRIHETTPRDLATAYAQICPPPESVDDDSFWDEEIHRPRAVHIYETLRSTYPRGFQPFAEPSSPYEGYPAYNLREDSYGRDTSCTAVFLVDIHT